MYTVMKAISITLKSGEMECAVDLGYFRVATCHVRAICLTLLMQILTILVFLFRHKEGPSRTFRNAERQVR